MCIYIYIEREREGCVCMCVYIYIYTHIVYILCVYIYIYMFICGGASFPVDMVARLFEHSAPQSSGVALNGGKANGGNRQI